MSKKYQTKAWEMLNSKVPIWKRYLEAWLEDPLWWKGDLIQDTKFYQFVHAVAKYMKREKKSVQPISEEDLTKIIIKKWSGKLAEDTLYDSASEYASKFETIINYEECQSIDAFVELKSISRCWSQARHEANNLEAYDNQMNSAEDRMNEVFGPDWRKYI